MAAKYEIDLKIDDSVLELSAASHVEAVESIYKKLLEHYFAEATPVSLPHPITEKDLHDAISSFNLIASFEIFPPS